MKCPICMDAGATPIIRNPADLRSIEYMRCPMACTQGAIVASRHVLTPILNPGAQLVPNEVLYNGVNLRVVKQAYGWSIDSEGEVHGLTAGDQGYEETGIFIPIDHLRLLLSELKPDPLQAALHAEFSESPRTSTNTQNEGD